MLALVMFFLDFICLCLFQRWLIHALPIYFLSKVVMEEEKPIKLPVLLGYLALIVLQDYSMNGHFGLCLIYIVPMIFGFRQLKFFFYKAPLLFLMTTTIFYITAQVLIVDKLVLGQDVFLTVTIIKIFVNLAVGILVFLGTRGDRFFWVSALKGRKVWTPNRIDAS